MRSPEESLLIDVPKRASVKRRVASIKGESLRYGLRHAHEIRLVLQMLNSKKSPSRQAGRLNMPQES